MVLEVIWAYSVYDITILFVIKIKTIGSLKKIFQSIFSVSDFGSVFFLIFEKLP